MIRSARLRTLLGLATVLALAAVVAPATPAAPPAEGDVRLTPIKYDALQKWLRANQAGARYTMIDAWATDCGPCKENFPHLVQMHRKFADKGLAVVSLTLDDPTDARAVGEARKFLKEKGARFTNFLLDEDFGVGYEKLNINAIPAVFVFGPDGEEVKRFTMDDPDNQFTYDEVERYVAGLLKDGGKARPTAAR